VRVPLSAAARIFTVVLGCAAIGWGTIVFSPVSQQSSIERYANRIISGHPFKIDALLDLMHSGEAIEHAERCQPTVLHSAAVIQLRLVEETFAAGDLANIDTRMRTLRDMIGRSLACSPADSFLWLVLFWLDSTRSGFSPRYLDYLRLSYERGPNEGWIGLKRNRAVLAIFEQLPAELGEKSIAEFVGLVHSGFYDDTVDILAGPGWRLRDRLLLRLSGIPERRREAFAKTLYRRGYEDLVVPGIERPAPRPWH